MLVCVCVCVCVCVSVLIHIYMNGCIYICTHTNTDIHLSRSVLSFTQILHLSHTFQVFMELPCIAIKTEICFSFSRFIKSDSAY